MDSSSDIGHSITIGNLTVVNFEGGYKVMYENNIVRFFVNLGPDLGPYFEEYYGASITFRIVDPAVVLRGQGPVVAESVPALAHPPDSRRTGTRTTYTFGFGEGLYEYTVDDGTLVHFRHVYVTQLVVLTVVLDEPSIIMHMFSDTFSAAGFGGEHDMDLTLRIPAPVAHHMREHILRQHPVEEQWEEVPAEAAAALEAPLPKAKRGTADQQYTPEEIEQYYSMFNMDDEVLDPIIYDNVKVRDYIEEQNETGGRSNIIFYIHHAGGPAEKVATNKDVVCGELRLMYECSKVDSMAAFTENKYVNLRNYGAAGGVANAEAFARVVCGSNLQIFVLRRTEKITNTLASHAARYGGSRVSDAHCQDGTQEPYYQLYVPGRYS